MVISQSAFISLLFLMLLLIVQISQAKIPFWDEDLFGIAPPFPYNPDENFYRKSVLSKSDYRKSSFNKALLNKLKTGKCLNIVALGGSITCGVNLQNHIRPDGAHGKKDAWPAQLELWLNKHIPCHTNNTILDNKNNKINKSKHIVINEGQSACGTNIWVDMIREELNSHTDNNNNNNNNGYANNDYTLSSLLKSIRNADVVLMETATNDQEELGFLTKYMQSIWKPAPILKLNSSNNVSSVHRYTEIFYRLIMYLYNNDNNNNNNNNINNNIVPIWITAGWRKTGRPPYHQEAEAQQKEVLSYYNVDQLSLLQSLMPDNTQSFLSANSRSFNGSWLYVDCCHISLLGHKLVASIIGYHFNQLLLLSKKYKKKSFIESNIIPSPNWIDPIDLKMMLTRSIFSYSVRQMELSSCIPAISYCNSHYNDIGKQFCNGNICDVNNTNHCFKCIEVFKGRRTAYNYKTKTLLRFNPEKVQPPLQLPNKPPRVGYWSGWSFKEDSPGKLGLIATTTLKSSKKRNNPIQLAFQLNNLSNKNCESILIEIGLLHSYSSNMGSCLVELYKDIGGKGFYNDKKNNNIKYDYGIKNELLIQQKWNTLWKAKVSLEFINMLRYDCINNNSSNFYDNNFLKNNNIWYRFILIPVYDKEGAQKVNKKMYNSNMNHNIQSENGRKINDNASLTISHQQDPVSKIKLFRIRITAV